MHIGYWSGGAWRDYVGWLDLTGTPKLEALLKPAPDPKDYVQLVIDGYEDDDLNEKAMRQVAQGLPEQVAAKIRESHQQRYVDCRVDNVSNRYLCVRSVSLNMLQSIDHPKVTWDDIHKLANGRLDDEAMLMLEHLTNHTEFLAYIECRKCGLDPANAIARINANKRLPLMVHMLDGDHIEVTDWYTLPPMEFDENRTAMIAAWYRKYSVWDAVEAAVHAFLARAAAAPAEYDLVDKNGDPDAWRNVETLLCMETPLLQLFWKDEEA